TDDPATPYSGARDLVHRIADSRLLTFVSTEHTAYTKNGCIDDAVDAYLLHGDLPRPGARCHR
ncbi:MAG TPA: alpha/beta hydrolase, partial [Acidimicrobiia bacterium]|nr:alpha/beta hydrolase [Acidimicrobiia bacterium]